MKKKQNEVKCGSVNLTKRVSAFLLGAAVALCLTAANVTVADQLPVYLGSTANFAVLTKTGISTTGTTSIIGDIGVSPAAASYLTGFGLIADASNTFSISSLVAGKIYAADYAPPTPANMTTAVSDMETAYTDAAGRTLPDATELGAGDISGLTLVPGLYKWGTGVLIPTDVTLSGGPDDVWIFQIAGTLDISSAKSVILSGGAQAKNIFWQVAGAVTLGTTSVFNGNILAKTNIAMNTGATLNGRALAQTAVTLDANIITVPAPGAAADTTPPTVSSTIPANLATGVAIASTVTGTFSEAMDSLTVTTATFTLKQGTTPVLGTVTYAGVTATFTPAVNLALSTNYAVTITTGAKDLAGNALAINKAWTFTTGAQIAQSPVDLGSAGSFVILTKSGISTTGVTSIVGDIGVSPIASTAITGFGLIADPSNTFSTSSLVIGNIYAADYTPPTPANLTTAVSDMETAYTNAAGRPLPDFTELGTGNIGGMTLAPGLYKWSTGVTIPMDVTLSGGPDDVWIFQIAGTLDISSAKSVILNGGAQAKNIFWAVAGAVTLGTTSEFKGIVLCQTAIVLNTGAMLNGRALAQTAVTLDANTISLNTGATGRALARIAAVNVSTSPLPVTLGLTDGFAILSYAGITNTGPTSITGDVGASPITGASMTGFETVALVGTIYTVDASGPTGYVTDATMLTQAMLDLTTAYNDAAGRTVNPIGIAGNLGGQTLPPGLYKSTSSLEISSGDLTLDAQGDANAVWIFQIASSFNMTSGRQVFLIGGAKASNIFWQVGSSATFGTTCVMKGTIMAYANITFATGASLEGRALARTASVTLDANVVTKDANVVTKDANIIAKRAKKTAVENGSAPKEFALSQNYPNPFNPTTKIQYTIGNAGLVSLKVYDVLGHEVATLVNGNQEAGSYTVPFGINTGTLGLSSGVYFYRLEAGSFVSTKKLILMK